MNPSFIPAESVGELHRGPLGRYVEPYVAQVTRLGYKPESIRRQVRLMVALNGLLVQTGRDARDVDSELVARFLQRRRRGRAGRRGARATLRRLLALLRASGVIARRPCVERSGPPATVVKAYREYLLQERGLAAHTVYVYTQWVERFLAWRFGRGPVRVRRLRGRDLTRFVQTRVHSPGGGDIGHLVTALRAFGRFLHASGRLARDLSTAIPAVARWSLAPVPEYLPSATLERVLACCDRRTPGGRRDYAILLLLARLGLRGGEVVRLELEDFDWDNGRLTIRASKNGQAACLPLPADVGTALAEYLRRDRPAGDSRRVFLRLPAPHTGFASTAAISNVAGRALDRTGVTLGRQGAHVFRHSLATTMLGRGASLPQIAQILRHRSLKSTALYAKVELEALRGIALPWPGGAP